MKIVPPKGLAKKRLTLLLSLFALAAQVPRTSAQQVQIVPSIKSEDALPRKAAASPFRIETLPVGRDAQLLTVFGRLDGLKDAASQPEEVPLVSVLRDTLGDADPENDRLRQVWMLTYTRPTALQRVAAKASTSALRRNSEAYRQAHILRALAILSLYEAETGAESAFSPSESSEVQARLMLTSKTFGGLIDDAYLDEVLRRQNTQTLDTRGHNWELLRQRAETEGLYFEPLTMPDGEATHAILYVSREDLQKNRGRKFGDRFLNIKSPWDDSRLARWDGHTETRYVDADGRPVTANTEGAHKIELI